MRKRRSRRRRKRKRRRKRRRRQRRRRMEVKVAIMMRLIRLPKKTRSYFSLLLSRYIPRSIRNAVRPVKNPIKATSNHRMSVICQ